MQQEKAENFDTQIPKLFMRLYTGNRPGANERRVFFCPYSTLLLLFTSLAKIGNRKLDLGIGKLVFEVFVNFFQFIGFTKKR